MAQQLLQEFDSLSLAERPPSISRLSGELLLEIFDFILVEPNPDHKPGLFKHTSHQWKDLRLVCRAWNDLVLETRALWTTIYVGLPRPASLSPTPRNRRNISSAFYNGRPSSVFATDFALHRSGSLPIDLSLASDYGSSSLEELQLLLQPFHPHLHRIRFLNLWDVKLSTSKDLVATLFNLDVTWKALEGLSFGIYREGLLDATRENLSRRRPRHVNPVDLHLSHHRFPKLRHLELSGIHITAPQDKLLYAQLRSLSLISCSTAFSFDEFLDVLARSTNLEELTLGHFLQYLNKVSSPAGADDAVQKKLVRWPRLASLTLNCNVSHLTSKFLSRIALSPHTSLVLLSDGQLVTQRDDSITASLPPDFAELPVLANTTEVEVAADIKRYHRRLLTCKSGSSNATATLVHTPASGNSDRDLPDGLKDCIHMLGSTPLGRLTVRGANVAQGDWASVFRTFSSLTHLRVDCGLGRGLSKVVQDLLAVSTLTEADNCPGPGPVPRLTHVSLEGVPAADLFGILRQCLQFRAGRGMRLEKLELTLHCDSIGDSEQWRKHCVPRLRALLSGGPELEVECEVTLKGLEDSNGDIEWTGIGLD